MEFKAKGAILSTEGSRLYYVQKVKRPA